MKRKLFMCILLIGLVGCKEESERFSREDTLIVGSKIVIGEIDDPCLGSVLTETYAVKRSDTETKWSPYTTNIQGFKEQYEVGYEYKIKVKVTFVDLANNSDYSIPGYNNYYLKEILSKEKKDSNLPDTIRRH